MSAPCYRTGKRTQWRARRRGDRTVRASSCGRGFAASGRRLATSATVPLAVGTPDHGDSDAPRPDATAGCTTSRPRGNDQRMIFARRRRSRAVLPRCSTPPSRARRRVPPGRAARQPRAPAARTARWRPCSAAMGFVSYRDARRSTPRARPDRPPARSPLPLLRRARRRCRRAPCCVDHRHEPRPGAVGADTRRWRGATARSAASIGAGIRPPAPSTGCTDTFAPGARTQLPRCDVEAALGGSTAGRPTAPRRHPARAGRCDSRAPRHVRSTPA